MAIFQSSLEEKISNTIDKSVQNVGYELVRVKMTNYAKNNILQIMFDRSDGKAVTIDDCEKLHYLISPILDVEDIIQEKYRLEVSSPGVEKPLTRDKDFINNIGSNIKISLKSFIPDMPSRKLTGTLISYNNSLLTLALHNIAKQIDIEQSNIFEASLLWIDQNKQNAKSYNKKTDRTKLKEKK